MAACFALGSAPGWSDSVGAIIENRRMAQTRPLWWCVGPLRTNEILAHAVRSMLWALPCSMEMKLPFFNDAEKELMERYLQDESAKK